MEPRPVLRAPLRTPKNPRIGAASDFSVTPVQAAVAVGLTAGLAVVAVFSAPIWAGILVGSGAAALTNRAIQNAA